MTDTPDGAPLVQDDRRPAFCYQTHDALATIRATFTGAKLSTAFAVYLVLTETANRSGGAAARDGFTATRPDIAEDAGISVDTLDRYVAAFVKAGLIRVQRRVTEGVHLPNVWVLTEPGPHAPGSRVGAAGGSRVGAAQEEETQTKEEEQSPPSPPGGELDRVVPANRPTKVNRKAVTDDEYDGASAILEAFNLAAGTRYASKDYISKIVSRMREHPELDLGGHGAVIAHALAHPWWNGPASPSVIYGNESLFERCLHAAASRGGASPERGLTPEEIRTFGTVWGPGTPYETLAAARAAPAAPHADIEVEAEDVSDDD